ncbi:L-seryl-tRNA(Sec) selenium transferase [Clostridium sardiniense]|uniref:L-seryl-tRNA(Sec) selenium transferase n=1 Tax=Clostridium sardiniense TaxID=29369 RepID=A0ABS7KYL3_CLOSR|nr:L-seryl-tRNA(Sec) selenium transferase [Clostridium sardiniense]MBY0755854.1 L-seryl-tRNA(Sec) selenium transferase [Clostridium sardiniense]MDQ0459918.1 L-seryl-tRNA(Ser) seleniumtransferase [Clostridium sardiniense]
MELLRRLPKVDTLLKEEEVQKYLNRLPRDLVVEKLRLSIDIIRKRILKMEDTSSIFSLQEECLMEFKRIISLLDDMNFKRVINGTGIVIHTNLGRSILSEGSKKALIKAATYYSNLEYDLESGKRGSRYKNVIEDIKYLIGAEDGLVVNNNAAAVLLVLNTICKDKEAIISRGELVEIGGSFRIPEIMKLSGGTLVEVGTTNRTHLKDYEEAISENTGAILKVHTSNYKILGFTKEVKSKELVDVSLKYNIPIIEDLGSGLIERLDIDGASDEKTARECIEDGVDILTFSGDKLLGGPQCGIIVGKRVWIEKIKKNQLNRALRVDKFTLAALEGTLKEYVKGCSFNIPTINMLTMPLKDIENKIDLLIKELSFLDDKFNIEKSLEKSLVGGGSLPLLEIDTYVLKINSEFLKDHVIEEELRKNHIPIVVRVSRGKIIIDGRCLILDDIDVIKEAFKSIGEKI